MYNLTKKERAELEKLFVVMYEKKKVSKYKTAYKSMLKRFIPEQKNSLSNKINLG